MRTATQDTNAAERKRRLEEARYRKGSHGRRHQALMAFATAGYEAPAERYMMEVESNITEVKMSNADMLDMLKGIQAQLNRIEERLNGAAPSLTAAASGQFAAVALSATIDKGKTYWKVQGGSFMQYGIMIWPEVLAQTDFADADPLKAHDLTGYTAVYSENEDGQKKIISLSKATNGSRANTPPPAEPLESRPTPRSNGSTAAIPANRPDGDIEHWRKQCQTAVDEADFDLCMLRLDDWFRNVQNVTSFRTSLFGEAWRPEEAPAMTAAMEKYAAERRRVHGPSAHKQAKVEALVVFEKQLKTAVNIS